MNLSFEGLPLLILFLLPGFFVFYTKQFLNPAIDHRPDNFELGLLSLGYSTVISVGQALIFAVALYRIDSKYADLLISSPVAAIQNHPIRTLGIVFIWVLFSVSLALFVGVLDPYHVLLRQFHHRVSVSEKNIWFAILDEERRKLGETTLALGNVRLKNGDVFYGFIDSYEIIPNDDGDRNFAVMNARYSKSGVAGSDAVFVGENSFVLLNTRDVDSIEIMMLTPDSQVVNTE